LINQVTTKNYFSYEDVQIFTGRNQETIFRYDDTIARNLRNELVYVCQCLHKVGYYNKPLDKFDPELVKTHLKTLTPVIYARIKERSSIVTYANHTTSDPIDTVTYIRDEDGKVVRTQDGWSVQYSNDTSCDDKLLVYPFTYDKESQERAWISTIPLEPLHPQRGVSYSSQQPKMHKSVAVWAHCYESLMPKVHLTDNLVNFLLLSIQNNFEQTTNYGFQFMNSNFYDQLAFGVDGLSQVKTYARGIDLFKKKIILIPICKDLHWTLCVVVNPRCVLSSRSGTNNKPCPCIIYFDSYSDGNKDHGVHLNILNWLNQQWEYLGYDMHYDGTEEPFTTDSFPMHCPKRKFSPSMISLLLRFISTFLNLYFFETLQQYPNKQIIVIVESLFFATHTH